MLTLDFGQTQVTDVAHRRRLTLQPSTLHHNRVGETHLMYKGNCVDEQPDHALHTGQLFRTAGNNNAENDVAAIGEPAEHDSPCEKHCGIEGKTVATRPRSQ